MSRHDVVGTDKIDLNGCRSGWRVCILQQYFYQSYVHLRHDVKIILGATWMYLKKFIHHTINYHVLNLLKRYCWFKYDLGQNINTMHPMFDPMTSRS